MIRITDRRADIVGRVSSLDGLEFVECGGILDVGMADLAVLPFY
jgi:hypothetical protein